MTNCQRPFVASPPISARMRRAAAFHEAGHAVAALQFGWPIDRLTIIADVDRDGLSRGGHIQITKRLEREDPAKAMVFALAGPAAQRRGVPRSHVQASGISDFQEVERLARIHCRTIHSERTLKRFAAQEAKALVSDAWAKVDAIAQALLARYVLTGSDVDRIIHPITQAQATAWQHITMPTVEQQRQFNDRREARHVTVRDVASAVLDVALRNAVTGEATSLATPATINTVLDVMACRGLDTDKSKIKLEELIATRHAAMQWRTVSDHLKGRRLLRARGMSNNEKVLSLPPLAFVPPNKGQGHQAAPIHPLPLGSSPATSNEGCAAACTVSRDSAQIWVRSPQVASWEA